MHYCNPEWHMGQVIPSDYLILAPPAERTLNSPSFSVCQAHVGRALDDMLGRIPVVTVHRVNTRAKPGLDTEAIRE